MKKLILIAVAAMLVTACGEIYWPGDTRVVSGTHPGCSQFGYSKYDENAYPECKIPEGAVRVGSLIVKAGPDGKPLKAE